MANTKITDLSEDTTPADGDFLVTVDVSDTSEAATGTDKKVQASNLVVQKLRTSTGPAVLTVGAVTDGEFLKRSGTSIISAAAGGGGLGDVVGPGSSTDEAIARFDTTTGKLLQDAAVTVNDAGAVTVPEIAAPSTPAANKVVLYAKSDGLLYSKDDAGAETLVSGGTGGGSPAGSDKQVQYNNAGAFGASANLNWLSPWLMLSQSNSGILGWSNDATNLLSGIIGNGKGGVRPIRGAATDPGVFYSATVESTGTGALNPWHTLGQVFRRVMGGNITINRPQSDGGTNSFSGPIITIILVQDGTGSRTATWATEYKWVGGTAPTLTTAANSTDIFRFWVDENNQAWEVSRALDVK